MRIYVTGATGFVGSNVAKVFAEIHGAELCAPVHFPRSDHETGPIVDLTDRRAVLDSVDAFQPEVIVHCAIWNDMAGLSRDRYLGWESYVSATRHVVDAANAVKAKVILVSTDWVFDGTHHGSDERTPPNPVNLYGVLKMASELVVTERALDGAVARVAGVNGVHWGRLTSTRAQDAGFGYLVGSIVDALSAGRLFNVWESADINMVTTPSLASDCAELMWGIVERDQRGIFHCCGGESTTRRQLAELTADVFDLDSALLRYGPPPPGAVPQMRVPYDTSLSATYTAAALGVDLPSARDLLERFRKQLATDQP
jgi:dTDP-4-dehydrorhamnose reductase